MTAMPMLCRTLQCTLAWGQTLRPFACFSGQTCQNAGGPFQWTVWRWNCQTHPGVGRTTPGPSASWRIWNQAAAQQSCWFPWRISGSHCVPAPRLQPAFDVSSTGAPLRLATSSKSFTKCIRSLAVPLLTLALEDAALDDEITNDKSLAALLVVLQPSHMDGAEQPTQLYGKKPNKNN